MSARCKTCGGTGVVHVSVDMGGGNGVRMTMIEDDHCPDCEDTGEKRETSDGD